MGLESAKKNEGDGVIGRKNDFLTGKNLFCPTLRSQKLNFEAVSVNIEADENATLKPYSFNIASSTALGIVAIHEHKSPPWHDEGW